MKFVTALVVLAVAFSVDASAVLPLPLAWANQWQPSVALSSHWASPSLTATKIIAAPAAWQIAPAAYVAHSVPAAVHVHAAPAAIIHAAPVAVEGQYVAANRGSVHVAPLPGHTQSASSINLQPADGTW